MIILALKGDIMKTKLGSSVLAGMLFFLFFSAFPGGSEAVAPEKSDKKGILDSYGKLPLYFIENKGQLDSKVRFYVKTSGQTIYFTDEKIVFDLLRAKEGTGKGRELAKKGHQNREIKKERLVFNLEFENAQKGVMIEGLDRQEAGINYFVGNDRRKWKTGISTYKGILYKGIYKGVDLKVFGNGKDLEYEFIVNPGGNPNDILLTYNGIKALVKNGEGELLIGTAFGELKETKPYIYQEIEGKRAVHGGFEIRCPAGQIQTGKFSYGFRIASYNPSYSIVIDPTLSYSTYLGGSGSDGGYGIAVDSAGNAYVTGSTRSSDFPAQNPYQGTFAGGDEDAFIAKLSASGNALVYSTYLGGSGSDKGQGIGVDGSGNAYVTGKTDSSDFPAQNPYQGTFAGGDDDVFIAKLSASGNALVYSTYLGGSGSDYASRIAVDGSGNAFVTGKTDSKDFPTQNPYQGIYAGGREDAFIAKLSASGNALVYSTYLGGSDWDYGSGIAVDGSGNAYVAGWTISSDFPTQNPFQGNLCGSSDAFITKLSSSGTALVYSTYLGGSMQDDGNEIAVDSSGNAYVMGITYSSDFPTQNPFQGAMAGKVDVFITKLSASGNALAYSTYLGGSERDEGAGIALNGAGNVYVTGRTYSKDFPTQNPYQGNLFGNTDAFITKLSASGIALAYSTYLGGSSTEWGRGIAVDSSGNAYVTGWTISSDFPTQNPFQGGIAGYSADAFITKLVEAFKLVTVKGTITNADTGKGIPAADVSFNQGAYLLYTASDGSFFSSEIPAGTYSVEISAAKYDTKALSNVVLSPDIANDLSTALTNIALPAPKLTATTSGMTVLLSWTSVAGATGYALYYAPYPYAGPETIGRIDMGTKTSMSANLWEGAAFYVAIQAYDTVESSGYSNIEYFATNCTYSILPASESFSSSGGSGSVNVTTTGGCTWTATSNESWITITSGSVGTGNGTVSYSVSSNSSPNSRTGTITVAGKTFTVTITGSSDMSGAYKVTNTVDATDCGEGVYTYSSIWDVTQNGNNITVSGSDGNGNPFVLTGTLTGNVLSISGSYKDGGGTTTLSGSAVVTGNTFSGSATWTWSYKYGSCSGSDKLLGEKQ